MPSRYYAWCQRAEMPKAEPAWETALVDVFDDHQRRYGTRRLQVELRALGHRVGRQALRTALRRHGRKALQPKAFTPRTTDSTHGKRCAPNLLLDQPQALPRLIACGSAILPIYRWPTATGFIAVPFRTCAPSRWWAGRCGPTCPKRWLPALYSEHYSRSGPRPGLIVHSDRGGQYVGKVYKTLLRNAKAQLSHSRRGECYDNAQAESLWARLKTELLEAREWPVFTDLADAQASVADYFDYYNHKRRHSSIGYLKPYLFHQQQLANIT